jgi:hypothetical protein
MKIIKVKNKFVLRTKHRGFKHSNKAAARKQEKAIMINYLRMDGKKIPRRHKKTKTRKSR